MLAPVFCGAAFAALTEYESPEATLPAWAKVASRINSLRVNPAAFATALTSSH